jgi:hypothetical protein
VLYLWWVHMTACAYQTEWYQCLCRCLFRGLWNYLWLCSYYKMCTVYQKNTVINIAVTPLLSAWRPKNYQAKAVIVYTTWWYTPWGWKLLYFTTCQPPTLLIYRVFKLINMTNYLIKSIFKDKPSTVLKWAFSLCSPCSVHMFTLWFVTKG